MSRNCNASAGCIMRAMRCVPPAPGNRPILISGRPSARLAVFGGDAVMAGERQLEAAAERGAVDRRDPRLAAGFDAPIKQRQLAAFLEQLCGRGLLALAPCVMSANIAASASSMVRSAPPQNVSLPEVMTAPLIAASVATFSTIVAELRDHRQVDDVHRAAGHVPGDERDAVGVGVELEVLEPSGLRASTCAPRRARG